MKSELERYKEAYKYLASQIEGTIINQGWVNAILGNADKILNPPPEMEEVEVSRWECNACGVITSVRPEPPEKCSRCSNVGFTEFKGKRLVEKKVVEKVEVSGKVEWCEQYGSVFPINAAGQFHIDWSKVKGKTGTLHFKED